MTKRIVILSDMHCGHLVGLTPPPWQIKVVPGTNRKRQKAARWQAESWAWYEERVRDLRPVYAVLCNGDAIDGRGEKSNGTELLTADRMEQVDMAAHALRMWEAEKYVFTYGTSYHTGRGEDFEDKLAEEFEAKIGSHEWVDVNGVIFDLKHHLSSSSVPHTRRTALEREALWNKLWAAEQYQPDADIIVRSHVHYHGYTGEVVRGRPRLRLTTPALQGMGTKYGSRRCSGLVDVGLVVFDVDDQGKWEWKPILASLPSLKAQTYIL